MARKSGRMEILEAGTDDVEDLLDLWGELAEFHASLDPAFATTARWRPAYRAYLDTLLDRADARVLLARAGSTVAALGIARITTLPAFFADRRRGYIQDVWVRPAYRRRGVGRRLALALLDWLREEGVQTVELTVARGNDQGVALWESLGFEVYMHHFKRTL